jgi:hypothetical protein
MAPETKEGQRLLAHELTHVVQQGVQGSHTPQPVIHRQPQPGGQIVDETGPHQPGGPEEALGGASPSSSGKCHTCQIEGGVGVCCYGPAAPVVPECLDLAKKIIDECKGRPDSCLQEAHCAQCRCIGTKLGEKHCQCTGIV